MRSMKAGAETPATGATRASVMSRFMARSMKAGAETPATALMEVVKSWE